MPHTTLTPTHAQATNWNDWRESLEFDLERLFQDEMKAMHAQAIYVAFDDDFDFQCGFGGFSNHRFSQQYQPIIGNRWRGHGPGMVLSKRSPDFSPAIACRTQATVLHEAAHWFQYEFQSMPLDVTPPDATPKTIEEIRHDLMNDDMGWPADLSSYLWYSQSADKHKSDFVRSLVHCAKRAESLGWEFRREELLVWPVLGPMGFDACETQLSHEFGQMLLTDLIRTPEPDDYVNLWKRFANRITLKIALVKNILLEQMGCKELPIPDEVWEAGSMERTR